MLMFPRFHFLWNMEQSLWFLQCCGHCCFPPRAESGSGIVFTSPVALLSSTQVRLYRISCLMAEAEGKVPQCEGRMATGLVGSPSLCSPFWFVSLKNQPLCFCSSCPAVALHFLLAGGACITYFPWVGQVSGELSTVPPRNRSS